MALFNIVRKLSLTYVCNNCLKGIQICVYSVSSKLKQDLIEIDVDNKITQTILSTNTEDLTPLSPFYPKTFNLAAYVNSSELLQNFVHLNVNLSKIEKKPFLVEKLLRLDIENVKKHIFFLKEYVSGDEIGNYLTKNPMIFYESLQDLEVRIHYLQSKNFTNSQIQRVVSKNPFWLMFSTTRIDKRLGYFQNKFGLSGTEVRLLATKQARLITYNLHHVNTNTFALREEMGFNDVEMKNLILGKPNLWMLDHLSLLRRFNYVHNIMNISHATIVHNPEVLLCRNFRLKQRHLFLKKLGRDQFDPKKENYVPIKVLVENTDAEFCKKYAKCNVHDYNIFLKTL